MEPVEKEKAELIAGIEEDARLEEEKIIKDAQTQADEKRKYAQKKIDSLLSEADEKAREQAEAVKKKIISGVELEIKRRSMHIQDLIVQDLMARVETRLESMIDDPNYRNVLIDWITEAAMGLDAEAAEVNASEKERMKIDPDLLSEVGRKVHKLTGKQVTLTLSNAQPLKSQGIVLTAADGRTAFNNQVKTRMLRRQRDIRTKVYDALFSKNRKE